MAMNMDREEHGILSPDASDGIQGDGGLGCGLLDGGRNNLLGCGILLKGCYRSHLRGNLVVEKIRGLQIKEPWTHMAAHIRLVAVIAESLAATLQLLGWRQAAERPSRGCRPCCCWNSSRAGGYWRGH